MNAKIAYGAAVSALVATCAYYGISADSLTSWDAVFKLAKDVAGNPVAIVALLGAASTYITGKTKGSDKNE